MTAEAVISMALETLRDLLLEEARFLSGVSGEVKALQTQLKEMRCLLEDADKQRHESKTVGNWIKEIKDVAYRAEDAIETYSVEVSSKRSSGHLKQLLRRFSCILKESFSLHQIGSEISEIKSELERVTKSMQEYGIKSIIHGESSSNDNQVWKRQTFPIEIDDCFVGKEDELEHLVSLTLDEDQQHRVISIGGMGGIGKTTIARKVYKHNKIKRSFESFAWVCITQRCQIRSVLEDVLKQLNPQIKRDDISSVSNTKLPVQLCQIQKDKRCTIVVDDVWEIDHWHGLEHGFLSQGLKGKILLTTRKRNVADMGLAFELGLLNVDDGWELLKKKASPQNNIPEFAFEEKLFQKIGKEMVRKCGYLPLVISLLGGVLSNTKSMSDWELVNENINAHLYKVGDIEKEKEILGVLNLSYEDMPYYLKPCFLIMGLFKEDKAIDVDDLYRMWIAQDMISHVSRGKEETLMDIAELYLSELASRCIVQVQVDDALPRLKYRTCKLHDVVRELCLLMGKKEDFGVQILDYQGGKFSTLLFESLSSSKTRHLAIYFEGDMEVERDNEITIIHEDTTKHVRSLKFLNDTVRKTAKFPRTIVDFQKFKLLRVLVFVRFNFAGRKLPRGIGNLIHLRNLYLQECDQLGKLPSSISNLAYLHTLNLENSWNIRVPNVLRKMYRLKHLILPYYDKEVIGNYQLRLDEGLDQLETLIGFDSSVHELKSITKMKNLRKFLAIVYDNESLSAIVNAITTNWKNLQYSGVIIQQGCHFTWVEKGLMDLKKVFTCPNVHNLGIFVRLGRLLEECENQIITSKLVFLTLFECEIEDDPMEILGKLPFLEQLLLSKGSFVGQEMTCHALGFSRLKRLVLDDLPNLRQWRVEQMPIISQILIENCPYLEMIPDGLKSTVTLQELTIAGMRGLGKRVSEGGEDFDKVRHVPSIIIY